MALHAAIRFTQEPDNLAAFSQYLYQLGFMHRISEHEQQLVLWVEDIAAIDWVRAQYAAFPLTAPVLGVAKKPFLSLVAINTFLSVPISGVTVLLAVIGFLLVWTNQLAWVSLLSFQGFSVSTHALLMNSTEQWQALLAQGEIWRLFTPMFLHFSWWHLGFNVVIFLFFAKQIEQKKGGMYLLWLILLLSAASNMAQFLYSATLFGGLSGVVYGLIAFCYSMNFFSKKNVYSCPAGLGILSVIMIVIGFLGVFSWLGIELANWAHLAGLVTGWLLAIILSFYYKNKIL